MGTIRIFTSEHGLVPANLFVKLALSALAWDDGLESLEPALPGKPGCCPEAYGVYAEEPNGETCLVCSYSFDPSEPGESMFAHEAALLALLATADILQVVHPSLTLEAIVGSELAGDPTFMALSQD